MIITKINQQLVDELYIHDSVYEQMNFDYSSMSLIIPLKNYFLKRFFHITFNKVIYCELIGAKFWGSGNQVLNWELNGNDLKLAELKNEQLDNDDNYNYSRLKSYEDIFINVVFILSSGDKINIISEEIIFEEFEMNAEGNISIFTY